MMSQDERFKLALGRISWVIRVITSELGEGELPTRICDHLAAILVEMTELWENRPPEAP